MLKESSPLMRRCLNASDRWVRCQPPVSDSEASRVATECEQVWREMSRKIAPRRYFTTGDIADYTGLTPRRITKTARDPNSWLALFVVCAGKGKYYRFVDPTGWLLGLWCGFERGKRSFPGATRNRLAVPEPTEWQRSGGEIDAAFITDGQRIAGNLVVDTSPRN